MYNNYIIAVDENGSPYIAHAKGEGSWVNKVVQYVRKVPLGNGKFRYVYNTTKRKATTAAKKAWGSKVGRWIDSHDAGITERIMANRLSRKSKKASKKGYHDDAMAYSKRSSELRKESRDERNAAKERIKSLLTSESGWHEVEGTPLEDWYTEHFGPQAYNEFIESFNKDKETSINSKSSRPTGHQKNITGSAKEGSVYKRGDGLGVNSNPKVHGAFKLDYDNVSASNSKADSSAYYSNRKDTEAKRKYDREFAQLSDRWSALIKEEAKIQNSSKVKQAWERYNRYRDRYGKGSSQAKWAEQEYLKATKPVRDIENELRKVWEQINHQKYPW
jgi:hypothetical protein